MVSWLRRRRGVKTTGKAEDAAQWVDKQRQQAAEKLQAIQRGNKARAEALAKGVYQTGKGVVGFGLDTGKGVLGKGLDSTKMLLGEARTIADNDQIVAPTPAGAWFTPAVGWPQSVDGVAEWKPPTNLCPTRAEVPDLFDPSLTIGELYVSWSRSTDPWVPSAHCTWRPCLPAHPKLGGSNPASAGGSRCSRRWVYPPSTASPSRATRTRWSCLSAMPPAPTSSK